MNKSPMRKELEKSRQLILFLFDYKCVVCGRPSNEIHEIIPISRGKSSLLIKNRVVICRQHHDWAHSIGTNNSIPILQEKRKQFLIRKFEFEKE